MRFNFALISSFLLASAVVADRRRQSSNDYLNADTAGALIQGEGFFDSATGTFYAPTLQGDDGSGVMVMVNIDVGQCGGSSVSLSVGVGVTLQNNELSYKVVGGLLPSDTYHFSDFAVQAQDEIVLSVEAFSSTSGIVAVQNLRTGQIGQHNFTSTVEFCSGDASWVLTPFQGPLGDFGQLTIFNSEAVVSATGYPPSYGPNIFDIEENGSAVTSTTVDGSSVTITYL